MRAGTRLAIYGAGLVLAFGAAFGIANLVVPDSVVANWNKQSETNDHSVDKTDDSHSEGH